MNDESPQHSTPSEDATSGGGGWLRRIGVGLFVLIVVVVAFFLAFPSPIDPVAYEPPPIPEMTGALAPNTDLADVEILAAAEIPGPEDVDVDDEGRIYGAAVDGRIVRILADGSTETFADTGGRPLGLHFDAEGNLIVADGMKGLLSIDAEGEITTLLTAVDHIPLGFTDDVTVASDGTIYFSDASTKFGPGDFIYDMLEARPHGRLIRYDPDGPTAEVLLDDLYFANGVALPADERFVLVNETWRYRVTRYWLKGDQAGESDVFIDNLPGFPDGVSYDGQGTFWVAMFTLRNPMADQLSPRPFLKKLVAKLPPPLHPQAEPYGLVLAIDEEGQIVRSLHDPQCRYGPITSVEHRDGVLYLGSLTDDGIGRVALEASTGESNETDE